MKGQAHQVWVGRAEAAACHDICGHFGKFDPRGLTAFQRENLIILRDHPGISQELRRDTVWAAFADQDIDLSGLEQCGPPGGGGLCERDDVQPCGDTGAIKLGHAGGEAAFEMPTNARGKRGTDCVGIMQYRDAEPPRDRALAGEGCVEQAWRIGQATGGWIVPEVEQHYAMIAGGRGKGLCKPSFQAQQRRRHPAAPAHQRNGQAGCGAAGEAGIAIGPDQGGWAGVGAIAPGKAEMHAGIEHRVRQRCQLVAPDILHGLVQEMIGQHDRKAGQRANRAATSGENAFKHGKRTDRGIGTAPVRPLPACACAIQQDDGFFRQIGSNVECRDDGGLPHDGPNAAKDCQIGGRVPLRLAGAMEDQINPVKAVFPQPIFNAGHPGAKHVCRERPAWCCAGGAEHGEAPVWPCGNEPVDAVQLAASGDVCGVLKRHHVRCASAQGRKAIRTKPEAGNRQTRH